MTYSIIKFILSWACFIWFGDKKKFFLIVPTCYVAIILALITDLLMFVYPLWEYKSQTEMQLFAKQIINAFGIYFVVTYLFLQTLPKSQTILTVGIHIFLWSILCILIEVFAMELGYIHHGLWWNLGWSYFSDWVLFLFFYGHHKWRESKSYLKYQQF
jgi:hypothetical protein